ncbi:MAG: N-6 DNA methylase [Candidatus Nanopusillus acidilobi]
MLAIDKRQYEVQKFVNRKETSSYYTDEDGMKAIAMLLEKLNLKGNITLMDPFMGAGVTLSGVSKLIKPKKVIGIEINEEPCILAQNILKSIYDDVSVICGDAFKFGWNYKADLVISNPPFIRWQRLKNGHEIVNTVISKGYGKYIGHKKFGLHVLSIFLIDHILNEGGYAILVLPASTFYTSQASGVKRFLKENYDILYLVENMNKPSFSSDSGYKELIVVLRKRGTVEKEHKPTEIYQYDMVLKHIDSIDIHKITGYIDRNWLSLFRYNEAKKLSQFLEEGLRDGILRYLKKSEIMTGIEMYGPEFFFIPNKYWKIIKDNKNSITISNGENNLEIPKKYLVKCLRKPEYYDKTLYIDDPKFYILSIGDTPQGDLEKYIAWGMEQKVPALSFGDQWYKHVWKQINTRNPYGYVFMHNKIDLEKHKILANYSSDPLYASKDFFIIKTNSPLIAMWYNSTVMKDFLKIFGRKISNNWTELLVEDYLQIPVPAEGVNAKDLALYIDKWGSSLHSHRHNSILI